MNNETPQIKQEASDTELRAQSETDAPTEPERRSGIKRFIALMALAGVAAPSISQAAEVSADVAASRKRVDSLELVTPVNGQLKKVMSTGRKDHTNSHGNVHTNVYGPVSHTNGHDNSHSNGHTQPK